MERSRCSLHLSKLDEFAAFCETRGFTRVIPKGEYEILRMELKDSAPVIVHKRLDAKEHATTWGVSATLFRQWQRSKRRART